MRNPLLAPLAPLQRMQIQFREFEQRADCCLRIGGRGHRTGVGFILESPCKGVGDDGAGQNDGGVGEKRREAQKGTERANDKS